MESNIWFYTLSTIAQAMAAVAGIFAVFVVFKMDKIDKNLEILRMRIISSVISGVNNLYKDSNQEVLEKAQGSIKERKEMGAWFNSGIDISYGVTVTSEEALSWFGNLIKGKKQILNKMAVTLIIAVIPIILSVLFLVLTWIFVFYSDILLPLLFLDCVFTLGYIGFNVYEIVKID